MIHFRQIEAAVCSYFDLERRHILLMNRERQYTRPRQMMMKLCREFTPMSYPHLGRLFCRDHTTILHGVRTIDRLLPTNSILAKQMDELRHVLRAIEASNREAVEERARVVAEAAESAQAEQAIMAALENRQEWLDSSATIMVPEGAA